MKVKDVKKRGRPTKKADKLTKKQKASRISSASRVVKKTVRAPKNTMRKPAKFSNKKKHYTMRALTEYFEKKFDVRVDSEGEMTILQKKFRNKYLFPTLKESGVVYKRNDILFDEQEAIEYLQLLSRTLDKSDQYYVEELPYIEASDKALKASSYKDDKVIIKKSSNLSTLSEVCSGNEDTKRQETEDDEFIDQYEVDYLDKLKKASKPESRKHMKWLGKALDSYRLVENHKRNGIFYPPFIPSDIDMLTKAKTTKTDAEIVYPITLKTIGVQLSLGLYESYDDFQYDMK